MAFWILPTFCSAWPSDNRLLVAGDLADGFLDVADDGLGGPGDTIFVHFKNSIQSTARRDGPETVSAWGAGWTLDRRGTSGSLGKYPQRTPTCTRRGDCRSSLGSRLE